MSQQWCATLGAPHSEGLVFDETVRVKISRNKTAASDIRRFSQLGVSDSRDSFTTGKGEGWSVRS